MLKRDTFVNATIFLSIANLFSSVINYVLQIIFAKNFTVENFGIYNAVNALSVYYTFIASPLGNKIITEVATYSDNQKKLNAFLSFANKRLFLFTTVFSLPSVLLMFVMGYYAGLPFLFVLSIVLGCITGNLFIISKSFLEGLHLFYRLAVINTVLPIIRIGSILILFKLGFNISAVFLFSVVFQVFTNILHYSFLPKSVKTCTGAYSEYKKEFSNKQFYISFVVYILKTGFIYVLFFFMLQSDILLVKFFFTEYKTGIYSSAAVFGKAIVFLSGTVTIVLFPYVTKNTVKGISSFAVLLKGLALNVLIAGGAAVFLFFFSELPVAILGENYRCAIPVIKYIGMTFLPLSTLHILFVFYLAKQRFYCFIPLLAAFITELVCIAVLHNTLQQALLSFFIGGAVGCTGFVLIELVNTLKRKKT